MLKYGGGYEAFTKKYGDYFVWDIVWEETPD